MFKLKIFPLLTLLAAALGATASGPLEKKQLTFFKGHDLSSLAILEKGGFTFKDPTRGNATRAADDMLGEGGMNTVRLRLWVNPPSGTYNLAYTLDLAKRLRAKGFAIYLDYHFSDDWADPGHNNAPVAWPKDLNSLKTTLRNYVRDTLVSFKQAGVDLAIVSLGNEIHNGMLWPLGHADPFGASASIRASNFTNLANLYKSARLGVDDAVKQGVVKPIVMIHIDNGWDTQLQLNWFSAITASNIVTTADWDHFGFSFYPFYGTSATYNNLRTTLNTLADLYNKPLQVVETDWPVKCDGSSAPALSEPSVPKSVQGQIQWVQGIASVVKGVKNGLGRGVHYWEPAWLNSTGLGSACQDNVLFDQTWKGSIGTGFARKSVNMFQGI